MSNSTVLPLTLSALTLLLKELTASKDKAIKDISISKTISEFANQMQGLTTLSHTKGTNAYTFEFKSPMDMILALPKIKQIPNISFIYTKPDYLKEVSDAIRKDDYFKAFTLCASLYEAFGKDILINQFKDKPRLAQDITNKLGVRYVIVTLHDHGFIDKDIQTQMLCVNDTRNTLAHGYFISGISFELQNRIKNDIPKIRKTLKILKGIHDKLPKI